MLLLCFLCLPIVLIGQAVLTSPAPGGILPGSSATFTWAAANGVESYQFYLGTTGVGSNGLYNSGHTTATSANVIGLPIYGQTVYARLYSEISGTWSYVDSTYAASGSPVLATLIAPGPGSVLSGSSQTFTWTAGGGVASYQLMLGTLGVGSYNLYNSGHTLALSAGVSGLPIYGQKVYARLYSKVGGAWQSIDSVYTAAGSPVPAILSAPAPGTVLPGSSVTFSWTAGGGVISNQLFLGTTGVGSDNLYDSFHTTATSVTVTGLPTNGTKIYARLYSDVEGTWTSADYTYTEAGPALLSAFSCTSASMTGSGTDACTVTLNVAAPSGGLTVGLSSNNTAATVPASVTIPAGATSAGFTTTVSSGATAQAVTLSAVAGSISETFALQLNADIPTLQVTTSGSPSAYNGAVTFTGTISSGPTGTVTFYSGGVSIGTGTISGTTATFTTSSLTAGSQSITAGWLGNSGYGAVTSSAVTQVVNKAAPVITWSNPSSILAGTALSGTQLDATSTIPGAFVYSPAAGTVPGAGSQALSVTFTPTNTTDYNTATDSVTLTVNQVIAILSSNASSIGFGNVVLNQPATQTVTLSSTGTGPVTLNSAMMSGTGYTLTAPTLPVTLTPGQSVMLGVQFDPTAIGAASGTLIVSSTSSTNGTDAIGLTGTGAPATSYSVDLSWDAPTETTDPVVSYNVYRSPSGGSNYQLMNSSSDTMTAYVDSTVQNGTAYDYIVKSVDADQVESLPSSAVLVTIP